MNNKLCIVVKRIESVRSDGTFSRKRGGFLKLVKMLITLIEKKIQMYFISSLNDITLYVSI